MISIRFKEDKNPLVCDYSVDSVEKFEELIKVIYKPIIGIYSISFTIKDIQDLKSILNNKNKYAHLDLYLVMTESMYNNVSLAIPDIARVKDMSIYDYLISGIGDRGLLIHKSVVYTIYSSIVKTHVEVDNILDLLLFKFGPYMDISLYDVSKYLVINKIVYPRTVLISYINLSRYRKTQLINCLKDISLDIVLYSMIKQVKKLHKQKVKYLETGIGSKFIKELNTKNLNLMYYSLILNKQLKLNDITIILELYERGITIK